MKSSFSNNTCYKAVTNVHYNLIHNGTEGILSAQVYLELGNIKLKPNLLWSLSFKLTYQWVNQTKYFELSGYPGYIFGKPIITGYKTVKSLRENKSSDVMEMNYNHKYWLSVFGTDVDGRCSKMRRYNVLFRENIYAHCFIEVPKINTVEYCEIFQNEVSAIIQIIISFLFFEYFSISNSFSYKSKSNLFAFFLTPIIYVIMVE